MPIFQFGNVPPRDAGGFHFHQQLKDGGTTPLTASTQDELSQKVSQFRIANGYDIGDPAREVNDYLCTKFPQFCRPDPSKEADESPKDKNLRQRVQNWAHNRYAQSQKAYSLETPEVAQERLKVCQECPLREGWKVGCTPCVDQAERLLFMISKGHNVNLPDTGGCSLCGHDNVTASLLPESMLKHRKSYNLPDNCWMKQLDA